jgi:integrase
LQDFASYFDFSSRSSLVSRLRSFIVSKADNKFASAHDLRRSFGTRWAKRFMPAVLQKLMRHSAIETTLRYYADIDADNLAADLWREYGSLLSDSSQAMTTILAPNQRIF